jgi:uncharacterized membrane protein YfcA
MNEIALLSLGLGLGVFVQTTLGFGAILVAMPILLMALDLPDAVAFVSIFMMAFSVILFPTVWKDADKKTVLWMGGFGAIGLFIGTGILNTMDPTLLKRALGVFIMLYLLKEFLDKDQSYKIPDFMSAVFGFFAGFSSGLFAIGGPILIMYLNQKIRDGVALRASILSYFTITNVLRVPIMAQKQMYSPEIFEMVLWVTPAFLISLLLGYLFYKRINKKLIRIGILVLLFAMSIQLMI